MSARYQNDQSCRDLRKDEIAEQLLAEIVGGTLAPGEQISERTWAAKFGVAQASIREAIKSLLTLEGLLVETFGTAQEFLRSKRPEMPGCVVLDVELPGLSGLDLQRELAAHGIKLPIIFITGYGDIPMSVRAMKAGALEFLTKPFRDQDLLDAIQQALERDRAARRHSREIAELRERFDALTSREREVMSLVVTGWLNKQIGFELGISEITVKIHRGRVMNKMGAQSLAELVRMTERLEFPIAKDQSVKTR